MNHSTSARITLDQVLSLAIERHQAGDVATAADVYREVLRHDPDNAEVLYLLALGEHQVGHYDAADPLFRSAISRQGGQPRYHLGLGRNYKAQGKFDEAVASYRAALDLAPDSLETIVSLGVVLWRKGEFSEAISLLGSAQEKNPTSYEVAVNLGNALFHSGRHSEALDSYRRAVALRPDSADVHNNIGRALAALARMEEARQSFHEALRIVPSHAETLFNLGNLFLSDGDLDAAARHFAAAIEGNQTYADGFSALAKVLYDAGFFNEALAYLDRYLALRPADAKGHLWRGMVLRDQGSFDSAIEAFERAKTLDPDSSESYALIGSTHWILGEHAKAADAAEQAFARDPRFPPVLNLKGNLSLLAGKVEEGIRWYRESVAVDPDYQDACDNLLFVSNYSDRCDPRQLLDLHNQWGARQKPSQARTGPRAAEARDPRLRVGFVSPDFNQHSVAYFFEPLLEKLDRSRFETLCYYNNRRIDPTTKRLSDRASWWRPIAGMADDAVARLVEEDRVDVLIDLAGHTSGNRLGIFARQAAPVQMTWLGYPTTTGLSQIQYRLTDWVVDPAGDERLSTETLVRLPASYFCYHPPTDAPTPGRLPALSGNGMTFGSFNNLAKVSAATVGLWARALQAVPGSRLLLKSRSLGNAEVRNRLLGQFKTNAVDPVRITLAPWEDESEKHLAIYNRVDVALDTYPYNGATTTCEALWMGVPVVSLCGATHASRMGASILSAASMPELVAATEDGFVERVVQLAAHSGDLEARRMTMRDRLSKSALLDFAGFARAFEDAVAGVARSDA